MPNGNAGPISVPVSHRDHRNAPSTTVCCFCFVPSVLFQHVVEFAASDSGLRPCAGARTLTLHSLPYQEPVHVTIGPTEVLSARTQPPPERGGYRRGQGLDG